MLGFVTDFAILGTYMCYDRGRCFLWELWFRPTARGHTRVTTEDVVRAVLPAGTFISDNAHIWGHTRVRSCD